MAVPVAPAKRRFRLNTTRTRINLFLDLALMLAFVLELEMHFTGRTIHELLGITLGAALLIHIILHWRWIMSVTRTFFRKLLHESRFNYLLNTLVLVDLGVIIVTGILISQTLGLNLGLDRSLTSSMEHLHIQASNFSLLLVGLHVAVHWKWIASNATKYLVPHLPRRAAVSHPSQLRKQTAGGES